MSPDVKSIHVDNREEWEWVYKTAYNHGYRWLAGQNGSLSDMYSDSFSYIILRRQGKIMTVSIEPKEESGVYNCKGLIQLFLGELNEDAILEDETPDNTKSDKEKELIVFTVSGNTYDFKNVTNFRHTMTGFSFSYTGVSTGVTRFAEFDYKSTSGYALSDMEE